MRVKLAVAFVLLNALDIALTLHFVGSGRGTELNPIMAKVLTLPIPLVIAYKVLLPAFLVAILLLLSNQPALGRFKWTLILALLVAGEAGVCLFNMGGLLLR